MSFSLLVSYTPTTRWKSVYDILQLYNISCLTMTSLFPKPRPSKGHKGVKNSVSKPSSYSSVSGYQDLPGWWNEECWLDNETRIEKPLFQIERRGPLQWTHFSLSQSFLPVALKGSIILFLWIWFWKTKPSVTFIWAFLNVSFSMGYWNLEISNLTSYVFSCFFKKKKS